MRLGRFVHKDDPFWGLIDVEGETVRRIAGDLARWAPAAAAERAEELPLAEEHRLDTLVTLSPVDDSGRVFGGGANYRAHLERLGVTELPPHPTAFMKPNSALIGPSGLIRYPSTTQQLDYEVELVVVMSGASTEPLLGFTVGNDVSARDAKGLGGLDLFSMKALDETTPVGPWITTP